MNLIRIITSRFKKEREEDWILKRREVCKTCPLNTNNLAETTLRIKVIQRLSNFLSWLTRAKSKDLGYCSICGCPIFFLTREEDTECSSKEKYGDDKWKSIYIPNKK